MYLVRKYSRAKWSSDELDSDAIPADGVTADLRSRGNELSVWACENKDGSPENLEGVVIALAAAMDRASSIDVVCLRADTLAESSIETEQTDGRTPYLPMKKHHFDLIRLDLRKLTAIAEEVKASMSTLGKRFTRSQVLDLLASAAGEGELVMDDIRGKLRSEIEDRMAAKS